MTVTPADIRTVDQLLGFIRYGGQPKYLLFWGHQAPADGGIGKGCLSQWWPVPFTVDGVNYPSAEHYMMAAKALLFGDSKTAERIQTSAHPGAAKKLGRQVRGFDEQHWAQRRFDLVVTGNLAKFGQHPDLRQFLLGTAWLRADGSQPPVELNVVTAHSPALSGSAQAFRDGNSRTNKQTRRKGHPLSSARAV
jgi:ribA/ribD-fused uncharacterized protein